MKPNASMQSSYVKFLVENFASEALASCHEVLMCFDIAYTCKEKLQEWK